MYIMCDIILWYSMLGRFNLFSMIVYVEVFFEEPANYIRSFGILTNVTKLCEEFIRRYVT